MAQDRSTPLDRIRSLVRPRENTSVTIELDVNAVEEVDRPVLIAYWAAQQQRVGSHETARFQFSAFVIAGSVASVGLVGHGSLTSAGRAVAGIAVALINVVAIRFVINELRWIKVHQARALAVLRHLSPAAVAMQAQASRRWLAREDSSDNRPRTTSSEMLCLVHAILVVAAVVVGLVPHP